MTCSVCSRPDRNAINEALVMGEPLRDIARRYNGDKSSLHRHRECIRSMLRRAEAAEGRIVLRKVTSLVEKLEDLANEAHDQKQANALLAAANQLRPALALMGQLNGEIAASTVQGFLAALGANNEAEVRGWREVAKAGEAMTLDECEAEVIALGRLLLDEEPERRASLEAGIFGTAPLALPPHANGNGAHAEDRG